MATAPPQPEPSAASISARIRVYYVEDDVRTAYTGTVTAFHPQKGLRVWFDSVRGTEQEWVTSAEDEWEWVTDEPAPEDVPAGLRLNAIRVAMRAPYFSQEPLILRLNGLPVDPSKLILPPPPDPSTFLPPMEAAPPPPPPAAAGSKRGRATSPGDSANARPSREAAAGAKRATQAAVAAAQPSRASKRQLLATEGAHAAAEQGAVQPPRSGKRKGRPDGPGADAMAATAAAASAAALAMADPHAEMRDPPSASSAAAGVTGTPPASAAPPGGTRAAVASTLKVRVGHGPLLVLPEAFAERAKAAMTQRPNPYPPRDDASRYGLCEISGLPAKYRDPRTGKRYGSLEAFKVLRGQPAA